MKILLIAGHGGIDPGACGCGKKESNLTREMVNFIKPELEKYAEVEISDTKRDTYQFLKNGGKINFKNYDYMLEIHFNAGGGKGTEILIHQTEIGTAVEQCIADKIAGLGFQSRGVKRTNSFLVMNTCKKVYGVSCSLLEVCFIDNPADMVKFECNKNKIAAAIAEGIAEGFGLKKEKAETVLVNSDEITWELNHTYFPISDFDGFINSLEKAKDDNSPLYWGFYKLVNKIK